MKKVLVALSTYGKHIPDPMERLRKEGYEIIFNPLGRKLTAEEVVQLGKECEGILAGLEPLNKKVLSSLPSLKVISRCGIGVDNIDLSFAAQKKVQIHTTPNAPTQSVVELTLAITLDVLRKVSWADSLIRKKKWERLKGVQLAGKTVGVIGLGRIGRGVAEAFQALRADVIGFDPKPNREWCTSHRVSLMDFEQVLKTSDILTLHVPKGSDGKFLIGEEEIKIMKPNSFLINLSRGGVVDEKALAKALASDRLAGAGLDVFENEPYEGPLINLKNIVLTAHMGSHAKEARAQMEREAAKNLLEGLLSLS